ncbi:hypothetical protein Patl1_05371 [Pistacia atlantica]|uniref:Uncharacterized protein n=1 Tax=Pistacia atlantica TaxID=434234 RepID=A0ACC1BRY6_9ROSI|nr:hypothetical protein Patl1_05371 [Pistacia atlantica]
MQIEDHLCGRKLNIPFLGKKPEEMSDKTGHSLIEKY